MHSRILHCGGCVDNAGMHARRFPFPHRRTSRGIQAALQLAAALALAFASGVQATEEAAQPRTRERGPVNPLRLPTGSDYAEASELPLSSNEPMYFVVGGTDDVTARIQLSLQYRILSEESTLVQRWPWLGKMHFGYTQTAFWDLRADSLPFKDTHYRPSLYWQQVQDYDTGGVDVLRIGYEHLSNGKDGTESRGIDYLMIHPGWVKRFDERYLLFGPKLRLDFSRSEHNKDVTDYWGYVDWYLRYGQEDGWVTGATLRYGEAGQGSLQLDFSYPVRNPIFPRTGGFVYVQLFHGYGETFVDYDRHDGTQLRIGLAIVR